MTITVDTVSVWTAILSLVITVVFWLFGRWSKRQDKAIKQVQDTIGALKYQGLELRRYIRQLLFILKQHNIDYPEPPDSFYEPDLQQRQSTNK